MKVFAVELSYGEGELEHQEIHSIHDSKERAEMIKDLIEGGVRSWRNTTVIAVHVSEFDLNDSSKPVLQNP